MGWGWGCYETVSLDKTRPMHPWTHCGYGSLQEERPEEDWAPHPQKFMGWGKGIMSSHSLWENMSCLGLLWWCNHQHVNHAPTNDFPPCSHKSPKLNSVGQKFQGIRVGARLVLKGFGEKWRRVWGGSGNDNGQNSLYTCMKLSKNFKDRD